MSAQAVVPFAPASRVSVLNDAPFGAAPRYVLYWMTANRRLRANFALQHAVAYARDLRLPLVVVEALRCDYPWASDRLHRFVVDGMSERARVLARTPVGYLPYVEPSPGAGRGLIAALATHAAVVVTDDYPAFFIPRMLAAAGSRIPVRLEAVDANGLLPMRQAGRFFSTARSFRAYFQRTLRTVFEPWPGAVALHDLPPAAPIGGDIRSRWPATRSADLDRPDAMLGSLPIDHGVAPAGLRGGETEAATALRTFVTDHLPHYHEAGRRPNVEGTSRLSPYLHFGHLSTHDVFSAVMNAERWTTRKLAASSRGAREGWWGVSAGADAFLDQLVTWRELSFNLCVERPGDYSSTDALPAWARTTLTRHRSDRRPHLYSFEALDGAATHDEVWNAAQRQLVRDGWLHNYLRMLWGKKILEWTRSADDALAVMIALMDRYAIDGRDPNTYAGCLWALGLFDRPWGPERSIFGTVRYMSSENAIRKFGKLDRADRNSSAVPPAGATARRRAATSSAPARPSRR
jgi:deoxyribodipyrimidine photo-lyase